MAEFHNCVADHDDVVALAKQFDLFGKTRIVKGWFEDTLPETAGRIGPISLLRIDADWHASVKCCLEHLYDQVSLGGYVILDDYFTYDGCAVAVHEFLGSRSLAHRVITTSGHAYFRKN